MKLPMNSNQRRYESIFQQKKAQHETQAQMKELIKKWPNEGKRGLEAQPYLWARSWDLRTKF